MKRGPFCEVTITFWFTLEQFSCLSDPSELEIDNGAHRCTNDRLLRER